MGRRLQVRTTGSVARQVSVRKLSGGLAPALEPAVDLKILKVVRRFNQAHMNSGV